MRAIKLDTKLGEDYEIRIYDTFVEIAYYDGIPISEDTRISVRCVLDRNNNPHSVLTCDSGAHNISQECITYMFDKAAEVALQVLV